MRKTWCWVELDNEVALDSVLPAQLEIGRCCCTLLSVVYCSRPFSEGVFLEGSGFFVKLQILNFEVLNIYRGAHAIS